MRVVLVDCIPILRAGLVAPEVLESDIGFGDAPSFAAYLLAFLRGKTPEEVLEGRVAVVMPMELTTLARHQPVIPEEPPLAVGGKQHVQRGGADVRTERSRGNQEFLCNGLEFGAIVDEQAPAGGRGKRHRGNELRVVGQLRLLIGSRPAPVKHEFSAGVVLDIEGQGARQPAVVVGRSQIRRVPGGLLSHATGVFQRAQEFVAQEGRVRREPIPRGRVDFRDAVVLLDP